MSLALEKNHRATPFVAQARALKSAASLLKEASDLLTASDIRAAVLAASGLSDKALGYLEQAGQDDAIREFVRNFLEPAGDPWVEELVYRFLLTRGDSLGGAIRNIAGAIGQQNFVRALLSTLSISGIQFKWLSARGGPWIEGNSTDPDIERDLKALSWLRGRSPRTLILNVSPRFIKKNIDVVVLSCDLDAYSRELLADPSQYISLGELKGGIDPAGADEHWKTARTALDRIRAAFSRRRLRPALFFVGAAIEASMAIEIWSQLRDGKLTYAANLTDENQLSAICRWLTTL